jgi:hypothetical protein
VTGTSFLDDYGTWDLKPTTFRRLINVYRYKITAVNAGGESAQSTYDEGSAQVTTAEFFNYMYDMPIRYSTERVIYKYGGEMQCPTKHNELDGQYTGHITGDLKWGSPAAYMDILLTNLCDYPFSYPNPGDDQTADYTAFYIFTDSIHNFPITFNGRFRGNLDIYGSGWMNSVNSSWQSYCDRNSTCSEPPAPYWPNPSYQQYLHVINVDADCYGWVMLHSYTISASNRSSESHSWVSYRGQRPVLMDKTSLDSNFKENGCP